MNTVSIHEQRVKKTQPWLTHSLMHLSVSPHANSTLHFFPLCHFTVYKFSLCLLFHPAGIIEAHKNHQICSMIGLEGGHTLGGSLGVLRIYYELGVRYVTLTSSSCHTTWADSHNADAPKYDVKHNGLTQYGKVSVTRATKMRLVTQLMDVGGG